MIEALTLAALVAAASPVEQRYDLPAGLLVAVVLVESGGRAGLISRRRKCGGVDVGAGQIHVHIDQLRFARVLAFPTFAISVDQRRIRQLFALSVNLDRAGKILASSRKRCRAHPRWTACRRSEFALYNAGSRTWAGRVHRAWRRLLGADRGLNS